MIYVNQSESSCTLDTFISSGTFSLGNQHMNFSLTSGWGEPVSSLISWMREEQVAPADVGSLVAMPTRGQS